MASSRKVVIGIDFGTTFSGVAWLFCNGTTAPGSPQIVTRWLATHARNRDRGKVPTRVYYDPHTEQMIWGANIPAGDEPIEWFKLLLLNNEDLPEHLKDSTHIKKARTMLTELKKDATQVTADYLGCLWSHTLKAIKKNKGDSLIEAASFHVVITVPAIYKDYGRQRMQRAAELAGILDKRPLCDDTTLSFVTEPESAVIATFAELEYRKDLQVGDAFVLCDCGGGTVDIISYAVTQADPLVIHECVEGDGALCGGTFLDQDFEQFIKKRYPGGAKAWNKTEPATRSKFMNNEWETGIKLDFDGTDNNWTLDLPKRCKRGQLDVTASDMHGVYDNVMSSIKKLVESQVQAVTAKTSKNPKGDDVVADGAKSFGIALNYPVEKRGYAQMTHEIYTSTSSTPSSRFGSGDEFPLLTTIEWELPVPVGDLPITQHPGGDYRQFEYEFRMEVSGASLDFEVVADEKVLGCKKLQVKTD